MEELLFLVHRIPYPPNKGDKIRSYHILRHLAHSYRIHLGAFVDDPGDWRYRDKIEQLCTSTSLFPLHPTSAKLISLIGLLRGEALSLSYFRDRRMQRWVNAMLERSEIKNVFVYSSAMAQYVLNATSPELRRVVDFVDVDSDKWRQYAERKHWPLSWLYRREAETLLTFEQNVAREVDASLFVSAEEAVLFRRLTPEATGTISYMENGVDHDYFLPDAGYEDPYAGCREVVVFTGAMDYWANIDAVKWFVQEVFPQVRSVVQTARFAIVGARPSREVLALALNSGVMVTGAVKDIRPYLAHARAVVAPLRIARGVQNKVLEAMAMARPLVATRGAVEGIDIAGEDGIEIADDRHKFAEKIIALLKSTGPDLAMSSRQWICRRYDWERNLDKLQDLFERRQYDLRNIA
jgi:sugar transferase (PEP-CTERM/EpsH1 system associated)